MEPFLKTHEVVYLRKAHKKCKEKRHADRIKSIILLNSGFSFIQVSEVLLLDDDTIRAYYERYNSGGLDAFLDDRYFGVL